MKKVCFFYLSAFSHTGGLEKFNRCFMYALQTIAEKEKHMQLEVVSVYDKAVDKKYLSNKFFKGFNNSKVKAVLYAFKNAKKYDCFILGHIHLAIVGLIVKLLNRECELILITHGIEVWKKFSWPARELMKVVDKILSVSNFTKQQMLKLNKIDASKINIFPNTLDPFFNIPSLFRKPEYLLKRYNITAHEKVVLTLSRLSHTEKKKGYDKVIEAISVLKKSYPSIKYIIAGKYDDLEYERINQLAKKFDITGNLLLTGFVKEEEVTDHYLLGDVFIMPSKKEGFGIVFLEAMACGLPVIGGNADGTVDALKGGELGMLVNADNIEAIAAAMEASLSLPVNKAARQQKVIDAFGFEGYMGRLISAINCL